MAIWYRRIFCLLAAYAFQRILFFGFNYTALAEVHTLTLLLSVLDGIRFDLCVIATVNLPLMAMHGLRFSPVMNRSSKWIDNAVSTLFLLSNIPLIIFGATLLTKVMERFPIIITVGAALLGFLAGEMLLTDPAVTSYLGEMSSQSVTIAGIVGALLVVALGKWMSRAHASSDATA